MITFEAIRARAAIRHGGDDALAKLLVRPKSTRVIKEIPDHRWLSGLTKCVFQAGFNWQLIEDKWDRFEQVFESFDVPRWVMMFDDDTDRLLLTDGIVKNYAKIRAVGANAAYLQELIDQHGSVGAYFSSWTLSEYCTNLQDMQKRSSRLCGKTGQVFLRRMGVDTLVFTEDVIKALSREKILSRRMPSSKRDLVAVQKAIDIWHEQSGYGLNAISQILALSVE